MPTSRATRVTSAAKRVELVHHGVERLFRAAGSRPTRSTVIFFDRSPCATAVATSAMLRTWPVRFERHRVDAVGQVFPRAGDAGHHGLAAELAFACRPRARRAVTSPAKALSWSTMVLMVSLSSKDFAAHVDRDLLRQVAARRPRWSTSAMLRTWRGQVRRHRG